MTQMIIQKILADVEYGNAGDAIEAAKKIIGHKLPPKEFNQLAHIATNGIELHNREAATYALSSLENKAASLAVLINILGTQENHEDVRGQAAEGIGIINPSRKYKLRIAAEEILVKSLSDSSPVVRFWSCYAVGMMKLEKAVSILEDLQANDHEICPGWWYVSEEAEDAIETINGRDFKDRIPVNQRSDSV